jgi:uncharacterized protein (TIGR03083 family)
MEVPAHIDALRTEGERMASAAAGADADAAVPTCPEWTVRELLRHTGAVHRWATGYVAGRRRESALGGLGEAVGTWPADHDLTAWFEDGCADLVAALHAAPDDLECWTFLPAPSPRAMWARRQAHETAIHRVDTQLATSRGVTPCDPAFAADGIDELLTLFVPRRSATLRANPPATLAVRCTDVAASWLLRADTDGVTATRTMSGQDGPGTCTVSGKASDLYFALWNRAAADHLRTEGDPAVAHQFADVVRIR